MRKNKKMKKETKVVQGALITRVEWLETVIKLTKTGIEEGDGNGMAKQLEKYENELIGLLK